MATVTLYTNYPFVQGGGHMPYFASETERNNFFNTLASQSFPTDFQPRQGARLLVSLTFLEAQKYNYCIWSDGTQKLYFFIEDYLYLNDKTTQLIISRDIWNDNQLRAVANPCNVHRMHMPRWNGNDPIIYPITEGNPSYIVGESVDTLGDTFSSNIKLALLITNKRLESAEHEDGIFYYTTLVDLGDFGYVSRTGGGLYINPFNYNFVSDFARFGIGLNVLIGGYIVPFSGDLVVKSSITYKLSTYYGSEVSVQSAGSAMFYMLRLRNGSLLSRYSPARVLPTKNTSAGAAFQPEFEPMVYADNLRPCMITDPLGYPVMDVPKGLYLQPSFELSLESKLMVISPSLIVTAPNKIGAGAVSSTPADGLQALLPCQPIDIPQSAYYDWVGQAKAQEKGILENNIRSRYIQTTVSGVAGIAGGGAASYGYAQAYGGKNAVAGKAGVAGAVGGVGSMVGSLINSYVQAQTDRDNFKLNEQKIKNTPTPPISGNNPFIVDGPYFISMKADDPTITAVAGQYHYYGYILDTAMPISLKPNRYYWMYLQTKDANITGEVNQDDRNYIASLLNRGLTIWNMSHWQGFGVYQYDNVEY